MDNLNIILKFIAFIIMAIGIISIYDARKITLKFFSSNDTNSVTRIMKIVGLFIFLMGCVIFLVS